MFDTDNRDERRRPAFEPDRAPRYTRRGSGSSLLSVAPAENDDDAAARHRLARLLREGSPEPVPASPAEMEKPLADKDTHSELPPAAVAAESAKAAGKSRWSIAGLVPDWRLPGMSGIWRGRKSEKQVDPVPAPLDEPETRFDVPPAGGSAGDAVNDDRFDQDTENDRSDEYWKPIIDPMTVIGGITKSRMLIVATTLLGALLGVAIALSTPKKYQSATELLVDPRDLKFVDSDLTQGGLSNEATLAVVENQVRVLQSGTVLNAVVDRLNLASDPEFNGQGGGGFMSTLRSILSRGDAASGGPDNRRALAVGNLAESLSIDRGGGTFVIVIRATTKEPEKSALIANTMTEVFLQTYGKIQSDTAGRAADELTSRLDELRKGVESAERKVETFKTEHEIIDAQGRLITDDEIVKLNDQLSTARARTLELNSRAASTRSVDIDSVLGGALPEQVASNVMTELRSQYAALKQESDRLAVRLGPRHPQRQAVDAQLAGLRDQINTELRRAVTSVQVELKRAVQLEQELASRLAQLKVRQGDLSGEMVTLRELEREASAKRAVYEAFLLRARQTGEAKDINAANMSVISKAYPPLLPEPPGRSTIVLTFTMLGFVAGVGLGGMRGVYESLRETANSRSRRRPAKALRPRHSAGRGKPETDPSVAATATAPALERESSALPASRATPASEIADAPVQSGQAQMQDRYAGNPAPFGWEPAPYAQTLYSQGYGQAYQPMPRPAQHVASQQTIETDPLMQPRPVDPGQSFGAAHHPAQPPATHASPVAYPWQPGGYPQAPAHMTHHPSQPQPQRPFGYSESMQTGAAVHPQPAATPQEAAAAVTGDAVAESSRPAEQAAVDAQASIEEIRASLREFREAVRELTESRTRRRYF